MEEQLGHEDAINGQEGKVAAFRLDRGSATLGSAPVVTTLYHDHLGCPRTAHGVASCIQSTNMHAHSQLDIIWTSGTSLQLGLGATRLRVQSNYAAAPFSC